ncbi:MAG: carbamoyltransferase [SAR202 cluster bacterium]|nr:carbamoyltransferase [SAR202 cluster bacterium]
MTTILGINTYHGDASAAIFRDGQLLAAAEEERFSRIKHAAGFPCRAVKYCLEAAGAHPEEIDHVAIPRRRSAHLVNKALWALRLPHMAFNRANAWRQFSDVGDELAHCLDVPRTRLNAQFHFVEHHVAHVASSFYTSPFQESAIFSLDGLGDFASMLWGVGRDKDLDIRGFALFPHSLGFYYTAITQYLGFWKYGDEFKVMGLAAYGEPKYKDVFQRMVRVGRGLDFSLGLRYFTHHKQGADMTWGEGEPQQSRLFSEALERELGRPARTPGAPVEQFHQDVAATLQWRLEEAVLELLEHLHRQTGMTNLAYAGGVAFNCVANGKIFDRTPFKEISIQPAAGDAGLAVGAALYVNHQALGNPRRPAISHAYWGPEYSPDRMKAALEQAGLNYQTLELPNLAEATAQRMAQGKVTGWYQGRTEWGPRALGNRSIVVDPRDPNMKDLLNQRIKHRETFRPFAPSILEEKTGEWFEKHYPSPYMLLAYHVRPEKRALIPAPTHVDGTGRLQTVSRAANPQYWELINSFGKLTGVPVVLNTSFNENEPVVNTPEEAIECFVRTQMDVLALGPYLVDRRE